MATGCGWTVDGSIRGADHTMRRMATPGGQATEVTAVGIVAFIGLLVAIYVVLRWLGIV